MASDIAWNIAQLIELLKGKHLSKKKNVLPVTRCVAFITNKDHWSCLSGTCLKALDMSDFANLQQIPSLTQSLIASSKSGYFTVQQSFGIPELMESPDLGYNK